MRNHRSGHSDCFLKPLPILSSILRSQTLRSIEPTQILLLVKEKRTETVSGSKARIYELFARFRSGKMSLEDEPQRTEQIKMLKECAMPSCLIVTEQATNWKK